MTKEQECMKALQCLYSEVPSVIADYIKQKVIDALNEAKNCTIPLVIKPVPEPDEIRMKARELDEKDFAQWMYEFKRAMFYNGGGMKSKRNASDELSANTKA